MKKSVAWGLCVSLMVSAVALPAVAQSDDYRCRDARPAQGEVSNHQQFCFTDTDVRGNRDLSTGANTRVRTRGPGISLIRHRTNFVNQMLRNVENF